MMVSPTVFDYNQLKSLKLKDHPFRYVTHGPNLLNSSMLQVLCEKFPVTEKIGHNDVSEVELCAEWKAFVDEIYSPSYKEAIETITGLNLTPYDVGIGIRHFSKRSHGAPHADVPRKKVTHLIYFNHEWPEETGRLRLLRSKNLDDVHEVIEPLKGNGLIFMVSKNSFHGFEPYEGIRNAIQINFERTGWFDKMFSRYE